MKVRDLSRKSNTVNMPRSFLVKNRPTNLTHYMEKTEIAESFQIEVPDKEGEILQAKNKLSKADEDV